MAYFPFFVDIKNRKCLVVGGGSVALRKVQKLMPFEADITVVAPLFADGFDELKDVKLLKSEFSEELLEDVFFVITATDDAKLNEDISRMCKEKNIPVNSADGKDESSFIFPALVNRGRLVVGICSSGSSPTASAAIKERISNSLPENIDEILEWLDEKRSFVLKEFPKEKRKFAMRELCRIVMESGNIPDDDECRQILMEVRNG